MGETKKKKNNKNTKSKNKNNNGNNDNNGNTNGLQSLFGGKGRGKASFPYSGKLRPGAQSEKRLVPDNIMRPDYAQDGIPKHKDPKFPWVITQNSAEDIEKMRLAGKLA